jgi:predicted permease
MSISVVFQQMVIILLLIAAGMFLYHKKMLSEDTSRQLSGLIVNVTNPAVLICSAFDDGPKASLQELGLALGIFLLSYGVLILFSYLIPLLLRVPQADHYSYRMLTIFGNVGFIGIPLASAVLGSESLIYVSINGLAVLKKAAKQQHPDDTALLPDKESLWHKLINAGTVSAVLTIVFYLGNFPVPTIISSTLSYTGRATTLLSMLVLGVSVAQMTPKDIFSHPKLYAFTVIRQILVPVAFVLLVGRFVNHPLILNTTALMMAMPAANMPLMLSKQYHVEESTISQGIILTTIASLVTIPIVTLFI